MNISIRKSKELLKTLLDNEGYTKFFNHEPVMFYDDTKEIVYSIHLVYDNHVLVSKQQNGIIDRGSILEDREDKCYDAVASFIVNAKQNKISWGCGKLGIILPKSMPPRDLSFITFLTSQQTYIYDKSILLLKIIGGILFFPYIAAKLMFDNSDSLEENAQFIFFYTIGSLILPLLILFRGNVPTGTDKPTPIQIDGMWYLLLQSYLLGIFIIKGIKIKYDRWREEWS